MQAEGLRAAAPSSVPGKVLCVKQEQGGFFIFSIFYFLGGRGGFVFSHTCTCVAAIVGRTSFCVVLLQGAAPKTGGGREGGGGGLWSARPWASQMLPRSVGRGACV